MRKRMQLRNRTIVIQISGQPALPLPTPGQPPPFTLTISKPSRRCWARSYFDNCGQTPASPEQDRRLSSICSTASARRVGSLVCCAHNPAVIELSEEQGWDVDYYMCCQYYLTRPPEEFREEADWRSNAASTMFLPSDRDRMLQVGSCRQGT